MKNFRLEDGQLIFDCTEEGCTIPPEMHKVALVELLAIIQTLHDDLAGGGDPRSDALLLLLYAFLESNHIDKDVLISEAVQKEYLEINKKINDEHVEVQGEMERELKRLFEGISKKINMKPSRYLH